MHVNCSGNDFAVKQIYSARQSSQFDSGSILVGIQFFQYCDALLIIEIMLIECQSFPSIIRQSGNKHIVFFRIQLGIKIYQF